MKSMKLFLIVAVMSLPPWSMIFKSLGVEVQATLLAVQLTGIIILLVKRKDIFG